MKIQTDDTTTDGPVLVLHTPIIKYIFEIYLGINVLQEVKTEKKIGKA